MNSLTSADGTTIAVDVRGSGRPVVVVNGALSTAADASPIADALADAGFQAATYDRRARQGSGDTPPYAPLREVEDLAAVIDHVGGRASVLAHSSGAVLALYAAAEGVAIDRLIISEPPLRLGGQEAPAGLVERLQALVDEGRPEDAVTLFQTEGVGLPDELVEQIRNAPFFPHLVTLAQSTVYDATISRDLGVPTAAMLATDVPTTIVRGEQTFPILIDSADRLAEAMPGSRLIVHPELRDHRLDPDVTAAIVADVLGS